MRVLIVDDDITTCDMLTETVKKWDFDPQVAKDGREAWEILRQPDGPRLVLLDWMMPEMDGLEVLRLCREHLFEWPLYIILLTSKNSKENIVMGLDAGANDYITKPFDPNELSARMRVGQRTVDLQAKLLETQKILTHLATHDPLTGIMNRRAVLELIQTELIRKQRDHEDAELCIGFIDVDDFKRVNDTYGHLAGDDVLKGIATLLSSRLRPGDFLGRIGGDEFLIIMPGVHDQTALRLFEELSIAIANLRIPVKSNQVSATVSIGVASFREDTGLDDLLACADAAMYRAKHEVETGWCWYPVRPPCTEFQRSPQLAVRQSKPHSGAAKAVPLVLRELAW
jgi:two-component system, cell cycle response regulator